MRSLQWASGDCKQVCQKSWARGCLLFHLVAVKGWEKRSWCLPMPGGRVAEYIMLLYGAVISDFGLILPMEGRKFAITGLKLLQPSCVWFKRLSEYGWVTHVLATSRLTINVADFGAEIFGRLKVMPPILTIVPMTSQTELRLLRSLDEHMGGVTQASKMWLKHPEICF